MSDGRRVCESSRMRHNMAKYHLWVDHEGRPKLMQVPKNYKPKELQEKYGYVANALHTQPMLVLSSDWEVHVLDAAV